MALKRIVPRKLTGREAFKNTSRKSFTVLDYWRYGFSSLNSNVTRGVLAEFLVENAIRPKDKIGVRNPWGDYDVLSMDGAKIEVKCSSYIQDWDQPALSRIVFAGLKARELYWSSSVSGTVPKSAPGYKSDIYVLAYVKHQEPASLDLLDLNQWSFFVISRHRLQEVTKDGNSVSLHRLEKVGEQPVSFKVLADQIAKVNLR